MIYTVTFNPSLDYCITVAQFETGKVNRTTKEAVYPGGKGINVSIVLKNLGIENTALGFLAGFTGQEIERCLKQKGIYTDFISTVQGMSRINVKLRSGEETEINGKGPRIGKTEIELLYRKLNALKDGDTLVLAGSIPAGMPDSMYRDILKYVKEKKIFAVVDATKELLWNVLEYHPFLIKPNHHELGELFGVEIKTKEDAIAYAGKLQDAGARNVLVSMGAQGAALLTENGDAICKKAPGGTVVNSVGAGDSMVAGFLAGYQKNADYKEAFAYGLCAGSASACSMELATRDEVEALLKENQCMK